MKILTCDVCGEEVDKLYDFSRIIKEHTNTLSESCKPCLEKVDKFLVQAKEEAIDRAWMETAGYALLLRDKARGKQ